MERKILQIDPMPYCNLLCPLCKTANESKKQKVSLMSLVDFTRILNEAKEMSFEEIHLFNWGESLLHPDIVEMIRQCKQRNFSISLHSNLNVPTKRLEKSIEAGLNLLIASIDGVSQEAYERYRKRGRIDIALHNLEVAARLQNDFPFRLTWQFIVNRFNEHELLSARELAIALGVSFAPLPIGIGEDVPDIELHTDFDALKEEWIARENPFAVRESLGGYFINNERGKPCSYLNQSVTIHPNLNVGPCCMTVNSESDFGSLFTKSLKEVINNNKFQQAHELFRDNIEPSKRIAYGNTDSVICARCVVYKDFLTAISNPPFYKEANRSINSWKLNQFINDTKLYDYLYQIGDSKLQFRVETAWEAFEAFKALKKQSKMDELLDQTTISGAFLLAFYSSLVFRIPRFSMCSLPATGLIVLGSNAISKENTDSDIEFMVYSLARIPEVDDIYLPAIVGVLLAAGIKVDLWCMANIFCGNACLTTESNSLIDHLDAPELRSFINIQHPEELAMVGEPLFCDLFGRLVTGNLQIAKKVWLHKLEIMRTHPEFVFAAAILLARWNLQIDEDSQQKFLEKTQVCLEIALNLDNLELQELLVRAITEPQALFTWTQQRQLKENGDIPTKIAITNLLKQAELVFNKMMPNTIPEKIITSYH